MKPSKKPSIEHEPHLQPFELDQDPMVDGAPGLNFSAPTFSQHSDEDIGHSVWDEPGVQGIIGKPTQDDLTFANWLDQKTRQWSQLKAWRSTLIVAALSGPWALLAVLFGSTQASTFGFLVACAFAPLVQEICKIALLLWVVEKRPYYFTGWFQIFFCSFVSATVFVLVLNLVNQFFFPPETEFGFVFAWTGFLLMHLIASTLSAIGLEKVWRKAIVLRKPPRLEEGYRWFISAYLLHVVYATAFFVFQTLGGRL